jgi:hypothetical protein
MRIYNRGDDAHVIKLFLVVSTGLGGVVRHEDDLFSYIA